MLEVRKMSGQAQIAVADTAAGPPHHHVVSRFPCWQGKVPEGFTVNFLGVLTRVDYYEGYSEIARQYPPDRHLRTEYPPFDEEYFEWIDLLEAVAAAEDRFTMLELGAGHGRWTVNAAVALRHSARLPGTLIAVEAEPTHFQWMVQHIKDNSVESEKVHLIQAAVNGSGGKVGFYVGESNFGGPANWYGQCLGGPHVVDAISLKALLQPVEVVDLIDLDIQGAELEVLEPAAREVDAKVKRVHIGTHGPKIDEGLSSLFGRLGWECVRFFRCGSTVATEYGTIFFRDGVQTWLNPTYRDRPRNDLAILTEKLEACREEGARLWADLERLREERSHERVLNPDSLAWKFVEKGSRLLDWTAPSGTHRRKVVDFILNRARQR
jgi:FkbM family methyltransferase